MAMPKTGDVGVSVYLTPLDVEALDQLARTEGLSRSALVRQILRRSIRDHTPVTS